MQTISYPEAAPHFVDEYRQLIADLGPELDHTRLLEILVRDADWTEQGATTLIYLANQYGTFVLANALALAEAMNIEDGEAGF